MDLGVKDIQTRTEEKGRRRNLPEVLVGYFQVQFLYRRMKVVCKELHPNISALVLIIWGVRH